MPADIDRNDLVDYEPSIAHIDRQFREELASQNARPSFYYVLSDSDSHAYEKTVIEDLSDTELWYAKNEIYARYGKGFRTVELRDHFENMPWYYEKYGADEFDKLPEMLNNVEKYNLGTIEKVERSRNSPHAN